jgi:hypothetical protein
MLTIFNAMIVDKPQMEPTNEARSVEKDVNAQKTLERFQNDFEYLWNGDYLPAPVKAELRQQAVAKGLIKGVTSDYQVQAQSSKAGKNTYG